MCFGTMYGSIQAVLLTLIIHLIVEQIILEAVHLKTINQVDSMFVRSQMITM